jgi:hypothetical protein
MSISVRVGSDTLATLVKAYEASHGAPPSLNWFLGIVEYGAVRMKPRQVRMVKAAIPPVPDEVPGVASGFGQEPLPF